MLSQDSAVSGDLVRQLQIAADARARIPAEAWSAIAEAGQGIQKVGALSDRRLAFGGAGGFWTAALLAAAVTAANPDVDELCERLPAIWRGLPRELTRDLFVFMAVGWSARAGAMRGIQALSGDGMRPRPIIGRYLGTPQPYENDPTCPEIEALWWSDDPTVEQAHTLHRLVGANCARSNRAGLYGPGVALGGRLHTAVVTREGAEVVDAGGLD
jgi:hypothetical protein